MPTPETLALCIMPAMLVCLVAYATIRNYRMIRNSPGKLDLKKLDTVIWQKK